MFELIFGNRSAREPGLRGGDTVLAALLFVQSVRRVVALVNHFRVRAFLRLPKTDSAPWMPIAILLPLLDESDAFDESLRYFREFADDAGAELYLITSDREFTINPRGSERDTIRIVRSTWQTMVVFM